ncbi:hypothetical protein [Luteococcus peritonei]|uniref:Lipoprotein n=1 Tax=Luteococcus peritonei TaxID=88874 RepID=A0ABW4RX59_9ACTN
MAGLLVAAALMTTGCGGGDEKTADPASSTSTQSSSSSSTVATTAVPDTGSSEGSLRERFDAAPVGELSPELVADIIKANKGISYSSMMTRFGGKKASNQFLYTDKGMAARQTEVTFSNEPAAYVYTNDSKKFVKTDVKGKTATMTADEEQAIKDSLVDAFSYATEGTTATKAVSDFDGKGYAEFTTPSGDKFTVDEFNDEMRAAKVAVRGKNPNLSMPEETRIAWGDQVKDEACAWDKTSPVKRVC